MTTAGTLRKSKSKIGNTTFWVYSLGPYPLSPCTYGVNKFHKPNANFCCYKNPTWTLKISPTRMCTGPTTTMSNHSSWLAWSLLSTKIQANKNRLHNIAKRYMSWAHLLNTIALGTYGWNHHTQPEFRLVFFTSKNIFSIQLSHQRMQSSWPFKTWSPH